MPLTDVAIRRSKPKERAYKLFDEKGLYLRLSILAIAATGGLNTGSMGERNYSP